MKWKEKRIGEFVDANIADIQTGPFGTQLKASDYVHEGTPVINVRNIGYGDLRADKLEYVPEHTAERLADHILQDGDIVFGRKGAVDRHLFVTQDHADWMQGSDCIRLRFLTDAICPRFVSYAFLSAEHQQWMLTQSGNKATMASLNQDIIHRIRLFVPPRSAQETIVNVLSAYDSLIENNRRRTALLEESARLLYREWFVRLRFPGHERTKIVDGVPKGWETVALETACVPEIGIQTGPFGSQLHQSDYSEDGFPVVMPKDIVGSTISTDSIARVPEEICYRLSRHILQEGDIVLARRGDIGRKSLITAREAGWMCGTGCMRLRPDPELVEPRFLFTTLGREDVMGVIAGRAQGAIMPNLNLGILCDIPIVLPPASLQQQFLELVAPIHRQVEVLQVQAEKLRVARDLLLPRLLSGEMQI